MVTYQSITWSLSLASSDFVSFIAPFIFLFPLIAVILIILTGYFIKNYKLNAYISVFFNLLAWLASMVVLGYSISYYLQNNSFPSEEIFLFNWLTIHSTSLGIWWSLNFSIIIDALSVIMISVVSTLSLLIQIYGVAYMDKEEGTESGRYNAEVSLFVTAMLFLSLTANFLLFFASWEIVGLCSYLLIGFFTKKDIVDKDGNTINKPASAAKKAFLITKLGDISLLAGVLLLLLQSISASNGSVNVDPLDFFTLQNLVHTGGIPLDVQTVIALLIFGGAIGKSAQFPLHIWLPDAMEGPTTVSALIHSATMVKAGVYLVARTYFLFEGTNAILVVGAVGAFTAIFAASMALVETDIKRVLAYSTISQIGYMFIGLGVYSLSNAMFHLISHSIFKCLLFLGAGSLIHAVHSNEMDDMGSSVRILMKYTHITFLIGLLGLSGIIPFNGFFSKDAIISSAFQIYQNSGNWLYFLMGLSGILTALLTAFYAFRMYYRVFYGTPKAKHAEEAKEVGTELPQPTPAEPETHMPRESSKWMVGPMIALGLLVIGTGLLSLEGFISDLIESLTNTSVSLLGKVNILTESNLRNILLPWLVSKPTIINLHSINEFLWIPSLILAVLGWYLAWQMYLPYNNLNAFYKSFETKSYAQKIDHILVKRYYVDDFFISLANSFGFQLGRTFEAIESFVDNSIVGGARGDVFNMSGFLSKTQSGVLQKYVRLLAGGLLLLILLAIVIGITILAPPSF